MSFAAVLIFIDAHWLRLFYPHSENETLDFNPCEWQAWECKSALLSWWVSFRVYGRFMPNLNSCRFRYWGYWNTPLPVCRMAATTDSEGWAGGCTTIITAIECPAGCAFSSHLSSSTHERNECHARCSMRCKFSHTQPSSAHTVVVNHPPS